MASDRDLLVAKLCVERGYASMAQVEECLREASSTGQTMRPLEAVLRHRGYISEDLYREISSSHRRPAPKTCPACATPYTGDLCPKCVAEFATAESTSPDSSRPGRDKTAILAPDVIAAAADPKNRFGKYVLVRELGAGGMGVVFKAWQSDLRRFVALKFIRGVEAREDLERFLREAQLAATLSHPGIAPIYEIGENDGKHFFAMQYVEGQTFDRLIASPEKPPVRKLVEILLQAAEAVEFAHEHGVIHRDLKPQNIMVDPKGRAYVMDFGLAKSVRTGSSLTGSSLTGSGFAVGTPSYMAPEQAQGEQARIGPGSDVYGLGAILYQMGAGRAPFEGENALQVLVDVVNQDPVPPRRHNPRFHPELETVALKALEKDPGRRFPSAAEFAADLRRWLDGEPVHARPSGTLSRMVRRIRKHKAVSLGTVALFLGLAIGGGSLALRHREKSARQRAIPYYEEAESAYAEADRIRFLSTAVLHQYRVLLEKAELSDTEALRLDPGFADAHFLLGQVIRRRDPNDTRALDEYTLALELEKGHVRARIERALWRLAAFSSRYGPDSISRRTDTRTPQLFLRPKDSGFESKRAEILADLEEAGRLSAREFEKALLEGAVEYVSWRPGETARLDRAEARLARAAELSPNSAHVPLLRAAVRQARGDPKGAAALVADAVRLAPNDNVLLYNATMFLLMGGRADEALAAADRAIQMAAPNARLHNVRGNVRFDKGDSQGALDDFAEAIRLEPGGAVPYSNAGYVLYANGRYPEALKAYEDALQRSPGTPDYLEAHAAVLAALNRLEEAEADLDRVIAARPDGPAYSNRGAMRSKRGRYAEAFEDYERALKLAPNDAGVPYNLGLLRLREGKPADAIAPFRRALEMGRATADGWKGLAQALLKTGQFAEAEIAFTKSLELKGGDANVLADRAQARGNLGKLDAALEDELAAHAISPDDAGIVRDVGVSYAKLHRFEEALPYLEKAFAAGKLDIGPLLAEGLSQADRGAAAEKVLDRTLEALPRDRMAWFARARIRHAAGRRVDAVADLDEALRLAPDFAAAMGLRGVIRLELKRYREAAADLKKAIGLQPDLKRAFESYLEQAIEESRKE